MIEPPHTCKTCLFTFSHNHEIFHWHLYFCIYYTSISISFYHSISTTCMIHQWKALESPGHLFLSTTVPIWCSSCGSCLHKAQKVTIATPWEEAGGARRRQGLRPCAQVVGTHNGITVLTHLDARNIRDSFRRVVVCHDVSICQHVLLIRQRTHKHTEPFPDFERVHLMLANLHGEFGLDRIAPNAGAKKSESLEYFNALASPNIKFILRKPFDIAAVRIAMWTTKLQQLAKARLPKSADPPKLQAGLHLWIILACQQTIDTNGETPLEQGVNKPSLQGQRQPDDTIAALQCRLAFSHLVCLYFWLSVISTKARETHLNYNHFQSELPLGSLEVRSGEVSFVIAPRAPTKYLYIYE